MANSAADARASELEIRKQLIQDRAVDVMVAVGPNMFYTVILPCTLWFLDRGKKGTDRQDKVLFLDARQIYNQIDRAHREFTPEQIEFLANIVRLYRAEKPENQHGSAKMMAEKFPEEKYADVSGLCKVATVKEIEAQGWSLNPGRHVGVAKGEADDFDFKERLEELNEELEALNVEAGELEERIGEVQIPLSRDDGQEALPVISANVIYFLTYIPKPEYGEPNGNNGFSLKKKGDLALCFGLGNQLLSQI